MLRTHFQTLNRVRTNVLLQKYAGMILCTMVLFLLLTPSLAHAQDIGAMAANVVGGAVDLLFRPVAMLIYVIALGIGGLFIGIGGLALDLTLQMLVVGMGDFFGEGALGDGVIDLWKIVRDIFNIAFIFSFIYLGIRTILNSDSASTQRALGYLLIAALLINFSLLITQAIVDFSNIAATQIYNQIVYGGVGADGVSQGGLLGSGTGIDNEYFQLSAISIAGAFMNVANITTFFGGSGAIIAADFNSAKILVYSIFMMVFFIIAGFVFLIAAIRLIYRFIALIIYMILSPAMFIGLILPKFASYASQWWGGFLKNCFYAPAFMFLIYMSLLLMQRMRTQLIGDTTDYAAIFKGGSMQINEFGIMLFFAMMIGLIYASVKVGDSMSVAGAKTSAKLVNGIRNNMQGMLYRGTAGKLLDKYGVGLYDKLDKAAEGSGSGRGAARFARAVIGGEQGRKAVERASNYGAGGTGLSDAKKMNQERTQRAARGNALVSLRSTLANTSSTPAQISESLSHATNSQIIELAKSEEGRNLLSQHAGYLSNDQMKAVRDSTEAHLTDDFKAGLRAAHETGSVRVTLEKLQPGINVNDPNAEITNMRNAGKNLLESMGYDVLNRPQNAARLTKKQLDNLDALRDDGKLTPQQVQDIKQTRETALLAIAQGNQVPNSTMTLSNLRGSAEQTAELPDSVLLAIGQDLTHEELRKIAGSKGQQTLSILRQRYAQGAQPVRMTAATYDAQGNQLTPAREADPVTPEERRWYFLNRDAVGRNLGV